MERADCLVIGAGIAGSSVGFHLAIKGLSVIILEKESSAGYHSTGRSAVFFRGSHGLPSVRVLTQASKQFFESPPAPFFSIPLTTPRNALFIAKKEKKDFLERWFKENQSAQLSLRKITSEEALQMVPILKKESVAGGCILESSGKDINQPKLLQGYLEGVIQSGGKIYYKAFVKSIKKQRTEWVVEANEKLFKAPLLINAAGAWADEVACLASIKPLGIVPKRRTVITFDPPTNYSVQNWPMVLEISEEFYFKPYFQEILASPADRTPSIPCDAKPEEPDCILAIKRLEQATTIKIEKINRKWAGLRSFVEDELPVIGFDPEERGFFWVAALGGSGIETSPAVGEMAACLAINNKLPEFFSFYNIDPQRYSPARIKSKRGT
ncbi:amino acid oxidase [Methylacidiphilum sp. Yel]|jgi:D-arginine dehydrogenase|uniref:NAD(P)/FAD-dependent oxidoreductase n=1 Tax=Methylacidiphilum sp. Yel TaxID=1847730 RepID=UPI00106C390D|nr:FAD-binding oxidoreductase [Methylacidiphilum sp. Yel]TFE68979.1 amino acid oxidase [Methylacidiphilum sp. Yel]